VAFGMLSMIRSLLEKHEFREVVICWDYGRSKTKTEMYPEYKKGRRSEDTDQYRSYVEIVKQIGEMYDIFPYFGLKQLRLEGVEADDVIGLLCQELQGKKSVLVVSSDRDLLQLTSLGITVYLPVKDVYLTKENFESIEGMKSSDYIFYHTLKGCSGDNITGLRGIGPVTAKKLIGKFGPWITWFDEEPIRYKCEKRFIKPEIVNSLKPSQKKILQNPQAIEILVRNYSLMAVGFLDMDRMGDVVMLYYGQKLVFDEKKIQEYFFEKQFDSILARFRAWIFPFRKLHYRDVHDTMEM
jgi:DNA polymerase-1